MKRRTYTLFDYGSFWALVTPCPSIPGLNRTAGRWPREPGRRAVLETMAQYDKVLKREARRSAKALYREQVP